MKPDLETIRENQKALQRAYSNLFETADGKTVLADLKDRYYDAPLFVAGDPTSTCYNNGLRDVVRTIIEMSTTNEES